MKMTVHALYKELETLMKKGKATYTVTFCGEYVSSQIDKEVQVIDELEEVTLYPYYK